MNRLSGLPYYGGKSVLSNTGTGPWINSLLPQDTDVLYCEPFAGMLGVLLQRQPAKKEVVNDKSEHIINWWRVVRDMPTEFEYLTQHTPQSRSEFEWAKENMNNPNSLYRALAFHVVCLQGAMHTEKSKHWTKHINPDVGTIGMWRPNRIKELATRLRKVHLECCDAVKLLRETQNINNAVIYCDPPYSLADTSPYVEEVDRDELMPLLLSQQGKVAISGYGDEWDCLDWHRSEYQTFTKQIRGGSERIEVLWTNYKPQAQTYISMKLF